MSLPSQEILDDIKELITEITGFQEYDENFSLCERYCLSHVVHHTYPFVSQSTVKNLVNSYVSRFYGHGYFKVSQELSHQVKEFLSNDKLFEKNPQYDIQWSLLSLLCSLSSNLSSVKSLPELLPVDEEESDTDDINWGEYLTKDLPLNYPKVLSSDSELSSTVDEDENGNDLEYEIENNNGLPSTSSLGSHTDATNEEGNQSKKKVEIIFDNRKTFNNEAATALRKKRLEEFFINKRSMVDVENDYQRRGNIVEKINNLLNHEGIYKKYQLVSEFEMIESILYQLQTGEKILLKKGLVNPALTSVTQITLGNFIESLQPYFKMIRCFSDFDEEVTEAKYSKKYKETSLTLPIKSHSQTSLSSFVSRRKKVSNVLYIYNVMMKKALEPFQNKVAEIVDQLKSYTLIKLEQTLHPYFSELSSLYHVHSMATKNWKKDCNWMTSVRILSVLYNAIMDTISMKMSFLYLNLFLHCFQVYLDIMDCWISSLKLIDPNDEFIVTLSENVQENENSCLEYEVRPYKAEMKNLDIKEVPMLAFISEKMIHVGQSLEILRRLNRFVINEDTYKTSNESYHNLMLKKIQEKIACLGKVATKQQQQQLEKPQEKKRSIFTIANANLIIERDLAIGDHISIQSILIEEVKETKMEKKNFQKTEEKPNERASCREFIYSTIENPFFKLAFDNVGIKEIEKRLKETRARHTKNEESDELMLIREESEEKKGIYPFHKIITEAFHQIFGNQVSDACTMVKQIVINECNLPAHLSLLRTVFFFNDAYLIHPFIFALFTQPEIWDSSYSLTLHLKECMRGEYKIHANSLSITLAKDCEFQNVLEAIDVIKINHEVKWPLNLVLTQEVMDKYNEIFKLALKLKWARWALSNLHFHRSDESEAKMSKSTIHRAQLLRFWFLSALSRITNYFMAQMLPEELDFSSCRDFTTIIQVHTDFINRTYNNCLLGSKCPEGKRIIFHTLIPLCMNLWKEGRTITKEKLCSLEKTFSGCHVQLSRVLSSLEKD